MIQRSKVKSSVCSLFSFFAIFCIVVQSISHTVWVKGEMVDQGRMGETHVSEEVPDLESFRLTTNEDRGSEVVERKEDAKGRFGFRLVPDVVVDDTTITRVGEERLDAIAEYVNLEPDYLVQRLKNILYDDRHQKGLTKEEYREVQQAAIFSIVGYEAKTVLSQQQKDVLQKLLNASAVTDGGLYFLEAPEELRLILYADSQSHLLLEESLLETVNGAENKVTFSTRKSRVVAERIWDSSMEEGDTRSVELQLRSVDGKWEPAPIPDAIRILTYHENENSQIIQWEDVSGSPSDYRVVEQRDGETIIAETGNGTVESPYRLTSKRSETSIMPMPRFFRSATSALAVEGKGEFTLRKVNEKNQPLANAEFTLSNEQGYSVKMTSTTDKAGIKFTSIPPGTYALKETRAPEGYQQLEDYYQITVDSHGITQARYVRVNQQPPSTPPEGQSKPSVPKRLPRTSNVVKVVQYNLTTTSKAGGNSDLNKLWQTSGEFIQLQMKLSVNSDANPGDSFVIKLDEKLSPTGIRERILPPIPLKDSSGEIVATGFYDEENNSFIYTLTNYVATRRNITVSATYSTFGPELSKVRNSGEYSFTNTIDEQVQVAKKLFIDYGKTVNVLPSGFNKGLGIRNQVAFVDRINGTLDRVIYVNDGRTNSDYVNKGISNPTHIVTLHVDGGSSIEDVKLYKVPFDKKENKMGQSMSGDIAGLEEISGKVQRLENGDYEVRLLASDFYDTLKNGNYSGFLIKTHEKLSTLRSSAGLTATWGFKPSGASVSAASSAVDNTARSSGESGRRTVNLSITNKPIEKSYFAIQIQKQDAQNDQQKLVAKFGLFDENGRTLLENPITKSQQIGDTKVDGRLSFENILPGIYTLKEVTPPVGYIGIGDIKFKISDTGEVTVLTNNDMVETGTKEDKTINLIIKNQKYFNLKILKRDGRHVQTGLTASFGLFDEQGQNAITDSQGKNVTGETEGTDHSLVFEKIKPGKYTLRELKAPEAYQKISDTKLEVKPDGTVVLENADDRFVTVKNAEDAEIVLTVKNYKPSEYPKTGGIGTVIFVVVGLVVMGGAFVLECQERKRKTA
ncbi:Serine-aspartate repeat-containing protein G precursor [Chlamydia trachomatis]|nr:Serine-aspartate repeat-containing protein G precursor [Chlamydia trachomatis]